MTAKHVTVEGLVEARRRIREKDAEWRNPGVSVYFSESEADALWAASVAGVLDYLPDDCPAEADAAALAEALREAAWTTWTCCTHAPRTPHRLYCPVGIALAAHDRRVKGGDRA